MVLSRSQWWQVRTRTATSLPARGQTWDRRPLRMRADTFDWDGAAWTFLDPRKGDFTGAPTSPPDVSLVYHSIVNGITALFTGRPRGPRSSRRTAGVHRVLIVIKRAAPISPSTCRTSVLRQERRGWPDAQRSLRHQLVRPFGSRLEPRFHCRLTTAKFGVLLPEYLHRHAGIHDVPPLDD